MRLIDADKLLTNVFAISNSKGQVAWRAVSTTDILTAPTVDAIKVVRCKDCKYFKTLLCQNENNYDNWFCADGERKQVSIDDIFMQAVRYYSTYVS